MISTNDQFYDDGISIFFCFAFENLDAGAQEEIFPDRFRSDVAHALGISPKRASIINIKDEDSLVVVKAVISDFYDDVSAIIMAQTIQNIGVKIFVVGNEIIFLYILFTNSVLVFVPLYGL